MDESSIATYAYEALSSADSMRVLILKPAKAISDPLSCEIIQYRRSDLLLNPDNTLHYTAVSYTWGNAVFSKTITCGNGTSNAVLKVTPNVDSLLRDLRKESVARHLWIDAICLNQANDIEKAEQIPLMGEIYEQAKKVRIWLGKGDDETARMFAFLRNAAIVEDDRSDLAQYLHSILQKLFDSASLGPIERFLQQPWFSRRWILQEAGLAQQATVHCGTCSIPWNWMGEALRIVHVAASEFSKEFHLSKESLEVLKLVGTLLDTESMPTFMDRIWNVHTAECKEPKDRLVALYGFLGAEDRRWVSFDYNWHWSKIFHAHARAYVPSGVCLTHLLAYGSVATVDNRSSDPVPSWVPDWSRRRQHVAYLTGPEENPFHAEVASKTVSLWNMGAVVVLEIPSSGDDDQKLELVFHLLGQVTQLVTSPSSDLKWQDVPALLVPIRVQLRDTDALGRNHTLLLSEMLYLSQRSELILEHIPEDERETYTQDEDAEVELVRRHLSQIWEKLDVENHPWSQAEQYLLQAIASLLREYSLFYLPAPLNSLGYGPRDLKVGDFVIPIDFSNTGRSALKNLDLVIDRRAMAVRGDDLNQLQKGEPAKDGVEVQFVGTCFCCFSYRYGGQNVKAMERRVYLI